MAHDRDGRIEGIEQGLPESRWVEQQIGTPVIKTFNSITAQHRLDLRRPPGTQGRVALPVAGDDATAKQMVMRLVEELGFDAVDAGGLDESWRQQPGTPCYLADLDAERVRAALADATPRETSAVPSLTSDHPGGIPGPRPPTNHAIAWGPGV